MHCFLCKILSATLYPLKDLLFDIIAHNAEGVNIQSRQKRKNYRYILIHAPAAGHPRKSTAGALHNAFLSHTTRTSSQNTLCHIKPPAAHKGRQQPARGRMDQAFNSLREIKNRQSGYKRSACIKLFFRIEISSRRRNLRKYTHCQDIRCMYCPLQASALRRTALSISDSNRQKSM